MINVTLIKLRSRKKFVTRELSRRDLNNGHVRYMTSGHMDRFLNSYLYRYFYKMIHASPDLHLNNKHFSPAGYVRYSDPAYIAVGTLKIITKSIIISS